MVGDNPDPAESAPQLVEQIAHVDAFGIQQPLNLQTIGGSDQQRRQHVGVEIRIEHTVRLLGSAILGDSGTQSSIPAYEELSRWAINRSALGRHRDVETDES